MALLNMPNLGLLNNLKKNPGPQPTMAQPYAAMTPQAQQGGQMFAGLGNFFRSNPSALLSLAAGLGSAPTMGQGFAQAAAMMPGALAQDQQQKQLAARRAAITAALKARTTGEPLSPEMQAVLESDPDLASKYLLNDMFDAEQPATYGFTEVDGTLLRTDERAGTADPVYSAQPEPGFRPLTDPAERAQFGIPGTDTAPYQVGPDDRIYKVGGSDVSVTTNVGQSEEPGAEYYRGVDAGMAGVHKDLYTNAMTAGSRLQKIDRLEALLGNIETGGIAAVKQMAGNFGIVTEGLDDIQAAQALINQLVPEQRPVGSGPMSDADLELFKQSMPRLINAPGGNALIVETLRGIAEYDRAVGEIAARAMRREIMPFEADQLIWQVPDPLAKFNAVRTGGSGGATPSGLAPGTYEWTPEGLRPMQ